MYLWKSAVPSHFVRTGLLSLGFLTGYSHTEPLERPPPLPGVGGCAHGVLRPCGFSLQSTPRSRSRRDAARGPRVSLYTALSFPYSSSVDDFWSAATAHPSSDFIWLHCEARQPLGHVSSTALPCGPPFPERGAVVSLGAAPVPRLRRDAAAQALVCTGACLSVHAGWLIFFF